MWRKEMGLVGGDEFMAEVEMTRSEPSITKLSGGRWKISKHKLEQVLLQLAEDSSGDECRLNGTATRVLPDDKRRDPLKVIHRLMQDATDISILYTS